MMRCVQATLSKRRSDDFKTFQGVNYHERVYVFIYVLVV